MPTFKYAQIEYERRFLLKQLPSDLQLDQFTIIHDVYIPDTRLRLRQMLSPSGKVVDLKLTQKYSTADLPPTETVITNFYLNEVEFAKLAQIDGRSLTKHRYPYHHQGLRWSLDLFQGPLHGLILADIEAHSAGALAQIPIPSFARKEVTDDPRFTGGALVQATPESIVSLLTAV
jgi:CYTH domain-containing protein